MSNYLLHLTKIKNHLGTMLHLNGIYGETTTEPLSIMSGYDLLICDLYADKNIFFLKVKLNSC